jgi:hypothetical protein
MKKTLSTVPGHITGVQSMEQNGWTGDSYIFGECMIDDFRVLNNSSYP